jgi:hypothetical protein
MPYVPKIVLDENVSTIWLTIPKAGKISRDQKRHHRRKSLGGKTALQTIREPFNSYGFP